MPDVTIHFDNSLEAALFTAANALQQFLWNDADLHGLPVAFVPRGAEAAETFENLTIALHVAIKNYPKKIIGEQDFSA